MKRFISLFLLLPPPAHAHWLDDHVRAMACEPRFTVPGQLRLRLSPKMRADLTTMFKASLERATRLHVELGHPPPPATFLGRPVIKLGVLGRGNEGTVFAARVGGRVFALKLLREDTKGPAYRPGDRHGDLRVLASDGPAVLLDFIPGVLVEVLASVSRIHELDIDHPRAVVLAGWFRSRFRHRMMDYAVDIRGGQVFELDAR